MKHIMSSCSAVEYIYIVSELYKFTHIYHYYFICSEWASGNCVHVQFADTTVFSFNSTLHCFSMDHPTKLIIQWPKWFLQTAELSSPPPPPPLPCAGSDLRTDVAIWVTVPLGPVRLELRVGLGIGELRNGNVHQLGRQGHPHQRWGHPRAGSGTHRTGSRTHSRPGTSRRIGNGSQGRLVVERRRGTVCFA